MARVTRMQGRGAHLFGGGPGDRRGVRRDGLRRVQHLGPLQGRGRLGAAPGVGRRPGEELMGLRPRRRPVRRRARRGRLRDAAAHGLPRRPRRREAGARRGIPEEPTARAGVPASVTSKGATRMTRRGSAGRPPDARRRRCPPLNSPSRAVEKGSGEAGTQARFKEPLETTPPRRKTHVTRTAPAPRAARRASRAPRPRRSPRARRRTRRRG